MKFVIAIVAALLMAALPARADEISNTIQEALDFYKDGKFDDAKRSLDFASQMLGQKKADDLKNLLPQAMSGWQAEDGESEAAAAGMAMLGGGLFASRTYTKGGQDVKIELIGDSPLLAQFLGIFSNPTLAGAMGKMIRLGSQMALEDKSGKLTMVVANRFLIMIEGSASRDDRIAYGKAIDYTALSKF